MKQKVRTHLRKHKTCLVAFSGSTILVVEGPNWSFDSTHGDEELGTLATLVREFLLKCEFEMLFMPMKGLTLVVAVPEKSIDLGNGFEP